MPIPDAHLYSSTASIAFVAFPPSSPEIQFIPARKYCRRTRPERRRDFAPRRERPVLKFFHRNRAFSEHV
ncbi:MAG: hypothetical protein ACP5GH_07250 [Nitrososphaeria archaeon]